MASDGNEQTVNERSEPGNQPGLTVLGATVRHAIDHVECFPAPVGCTEVRFSTDELMSMCPVTEQPDLSSVVIEYHPDQLCIESKSLKLFLWGFRDRAIFAEALAVAIADEVRRSTDPHWARVTVTQRPRGGIETCTISEFGNRSSQ
jgi:7-cyano-7-deazaguanine reductase